MEDSKLYSKEGLEREHTLERESVAAAVKKYRDAVDNNEPLSQLKPGAALMDVLIGPMSAAIKKFCLSRKGSGPKKGTINFLKEFGSPDEVAYITTKRIINSLTDHSITVQTVAVSLATMLKEQLQYNTFKAEHPGYLFRVEENLKHSTLPHRLRVLSHVENLLKVPAWAWTEERARLHIGMDLIALFVKTAVAEDGASLVRIEKPQYRGKKKHSSAFLRPTPATLAWLEWAKAEGGGIPPTYYPMVIPPKDWGIGFAGGFICSEALPTTYKLVKTKDERLLKMSRKRRGMEEVFRAVNTMQDTKWRINRRIYEVASEAWAGGGNIGSLPARDPEPELERTDDAEWARMTDEEKKIQKGMLAAVKVRNIRSQSKRVAGNIALGIAKKFLDDPEIYFVWSMDWRGRLYPVQSFIHPQADDLGRSLIEFAEGKELGKDGAFWLAVHGANCFGADKVSFEDRVKWVGEHSEQIRDSANNPLDGARFWCDAEDPYQFLAFCFEWSEMTLAGRPVTYVSHLCVGMDGSCNGLQNFSALLRDPVGGAATNLIPSETPRDIYQEVANVLNRIVNADAGSDEPHIRDNARIWQGKITRKVTKRGVMTTPYGSKRFGLRAQLHVELEKIAHNYLEVEDTYPPINYLAKRLYEAIREVVIAAGVAMDWLQAAARIMSQSERPIRWETPVGFMVIQDYRVMEAQRIDTIFGGVRMSTSLEGETERIDKKRSTNAISPNFIHSLDASHLMLTVNACRGEGVADFGMVHDSYGTHAGNVEIMNRLLRKTFIEMYSDNVFEQFRQEIIDQMPGVEIPELPLPGNLNLDAVADSRYFFA